MQPLATPLEESRRVTLQSHPFRTGRNCDTIDLVRLSKVMNRSFGSYSLDRRLIASLADRDLSSG
jgi:hypothetical protein